MYEAACISHFEVFGHSIHCPVTYLAFIIIIIIIISSSSSSRVGLCPLYRYCGHFWPIGEAPDDR
jgi:hypothetical protein